MPAMDSREAAASAVIARGGAPSASGGMRGAGSRIGKSENVGSGAAAARPSRVWPRDNVTRVVDEHGNSAAYLLRRLARERPPVGPAALSDLWPGRIYDPAAPPRICGPLRSMARRTY